MKKTKMTTKALSLLLTVIMLFTTISVGIIVPEANVNAAVAGETYTVNSLEELRGKIDLANTAGANKITTIKLGKTITNDSGNGVGGAEKKLGSITGNVILDMNGFSLNIVHSTKDKYTSQKFNVQLPSENAVDNKWHGDNDTVPNSMFEVAAGGSLQIINTSTTDATVSVSTRLESTAYNNGNNSHQTSSSLINNKGTLILGDKSNTTYSNFTLSSYSAVINSSTDGGWIAGGSKNGANASSFAVTVDGDGAIFKMYGGTIQSSGDIVFRRNATSYLVAIALNIKNCRSAEIYGGNIDIPSFSTKMGFVWTENANEGNRYIATAIRCTCPNLYIFNVDSEVHATSGEETDHKDDLYIYLSNIHSIATTDSSGNTIDNAAHVYGGKFTYNATRADKNNTAFISAAIARGAYKLALGTNGVAPSAATGSDYLVQNCPEKKSLPGELTLRTLFIEGNGVSRDTATNTINGRDLLASNGISMFSDKYTTFVDFLSKYSLTTDVYFKDKNITNSPADNASPEIGKYQLDGYSHKAWAGRTHPGEAYSLDKSTPSALTNGGSLFLAPVWEANEYNIIYDWNIPEGSKTSLKDSSKCPATYKITDEGSIGAPERNGYEFVGWTIKSVTKNTSYKDSDKNVWGDVNSSLTDTTLKGKFGNIELMANWSPKNYKPTIDLDGGALNGNTESFTVEYRPEGTLALPGTPIKTHYDFKGYYVSRADGSWQVNTETLYPAGHQFANIDAYGAPTFKAKFTEHPYTIRFDSNGGTVASDMTYTYQNTFILPPTSRTGWEFGGWYIAEDYNSGGWQGGVRRISGNIELDENGNEIPLVTYPAGTPISAEHFGDVQLKAYWTRAKYQINLEINGDIGEALTGDKVLTYVYNSSLTLPTPTRTGYTFNGWVVKEASDNGTTWEIGKNYGTVLPAQQIGAVTLEPKWSEANEYSLIFSLDGGKFADASQENPKTYTIENTFYLPKVTKDGYKFIGWTIFEKDEDCWDALLVNSADGTRIIPDIAEISKKYGNVTLLAKWKPVDYTVTLQVKDGEGSITSDTSKSFNIEGTIDFSEFKAKRDGYILTGWKAVSAQGKWENSKIYAVDAKASGMFGNVTLEAQWLHEDYTITFNSQYGDTVPSDITYHIDDSGFTVANPTGNIPGRTFSHWVVGAAAGNWAQDEKIFANSTVISGKYGNVALWAEYDKTVYTLTYEFKDADGSIKTVSENYDIDTKIELKSYAELGVNSAGYTPNGWKLKETVECSLWNRVFAESEVMGNGFYGNVVLVPNYEANSYTVKFNSDGGTAVPDMVYTTEDAYTLPAAEDITKEGFDFAGWTVTTSGGNWTEAEYAGGTAVAGKYGDVTLTAKWTPKKYIITWVTGSGTFTTEAFYDTVPEFNGATDKAPDAQYTYTFSGNWSPAISKVTGEATYTAQYDKTVNSYNVTWKYETDATGVKTLTEKLPYGTHPVFNNGINPEKKVDGKYYRFTGWVDDKNNALKADTIVEGDVTYTAQYIEVQAPAKITWIVNGDATETWCEAGEKPEYIGTPIKPDANGYKYTFSGWSDEIVTAESGKQYTYEAQFNETAQTYTAKFNLDGGAYDGETEVSYNMNSGLNMPVPEKEGYTFSGWEITSNGGTWEQTTLLTFTYYAGYWGNVTFKAVYKLTEYKITVEKDDGTAASTYIYTVNSTDKLSELAGLSKEGNELSGWVIVAAEGSWKSNDTVSADKVLTGMYGDVTIHPVWTVKFYKLNWVSGDIVQTVEIRFGDPITAYSPVPKKGYSAQWDIEEGHEIPYVMPADDLTFTAVYETIEYYIRFNVAGGNAVEGFHYDIETDKTLPTPKRDGAEFEYWKVSVDAGNWKKNSICDDGMSLNGYYGNVTLTAVWKIQIHTVTWEAGDVIRKTQWYHGAVPSYDSIPYKSPTDEYSFRFIGWDKEITVVTEDVTYVAQFKTIDRFYTVKWNIDGDIAQEDQYTYGATPVFNGTTPSKAPTSNYEFVFAGWSPVVSSVTADVTYIALFDTITKLHGLYIDKVYIDVKQGESAVLTAILSPSTATVKDVNWYSSNESVALVDSLGKVSAVGTGDALIRVESKDGSFRAFCLVSVAPVVSTRVIVSANGVSTTQLPGSAIQLYATIEPENVTNKNIKWSSSDSTIATVNSDGLVTFGSTYGTATITAVADGYGIGTIEVTSTEKSEEIKDTVKTYTVMFTKSTSSYIIADKTYESINIIYPEGSTVEFLLTEPHFVTLNGHQFERDADGVFRIKNLDRNYTVVAVERADLGFEEDVTEPTKKPTFFDKLKDFFRSIIEFFRNLFN